MRTELAHVVLWNDSFAIFCDKSVTKKSNWAISEERWLFWISLWTIVNLPHRKRFVMILEQRVASSARNLLRSHLSFFAVTKNDFSHKNITSTRKFGSQIFYPKTITSIQDLHNAFGPATFYCRSTEHRCRKDALWFRPILANLPRKYLIHRSLVLALVNFLATSHDWTAQKPWFDLNKKPAHGTDFLTIW